MSDQLRNKLKRYNQIVEMSKQLPALKKEIMDLMRKEQLTNKKFKFDNNVISYQTSTAYQGLSQKHIKQTLEKYYPQLDATEITKRIAGSRRKETKETLHVSTRK